MDKPIDRTWIGQYSYSVKRDEFGHIIEYSNFRDGGCEDVLYEKYPDFKSLPGPCKCAETKAEHAAFWAWKQAQGGE